MGLINGSGYPAEHYAQIMMCNLNTVPCAVWSELLPQEGHRWLISAD